MEGFVDGIAAPAAAAHGEREGETVVEGAAGGDGVGLVDDDAADRKRASQFDGAVIARGMESH